MGLVCWSETRGFLCGRLGKEAPAVFYDTRRGFPNGRTEERTGGVIGDHHTLRESGLAFDRSDRSPANITRLPLYSTGPRRFINRLERSRCNTPRGTGNCLNILPSYYGNMERCEPIFPYFYSRKWTPGMYRLRSAVLQCCSCVDDCNQVAVSYFLRTIHMNG